MRFIEIKNLDYLLKWFYLLHGDGKNIGTHLIIIGIILRN